MEFILAILTLLFILFMVLVTLGGVIITLRVIYKWLT
jgi:hypothetical protein